MALIRSSTDCFPDSSSTASLQGFQFGITNREGLFQEGRDVCLQLGGGDLASIHTAEENNAVFRLFQVDGRSASVGVFLGLFDSAQSSAAGDSSVQRFSWLDGSAFDFGTTPQQIPWNAISPDNQSGAESCVLMIGIPGSNEEFLWSDEDCSGLRPAICRFRCDLPPTSVPTSSPAQPTNSPTNVPSLNPTKGTSIPTSSPAQPTNSPTNVPSLNPTKGTSIPTSSPAKPTNSPTIKGTSIPSNVPSISPTQSPGIEPLADSATSVGAIFGVVGFVGALVLILGLWIGGRRRNHKRNASSSPTEFKLRVIDTSGDPNKQRLWLENRPSGVALPETPKHNLKNRQWRNTKNTEYPPTAANNPSYPGQLRYATPVPNQNKKVRSTPMNGHSQRKKRNKNKNLSWSSNRTLTSSGYGERSASSFGNSSQQTNTTNPRYKFKF